MAPRLTIWMFRTLQSHPRCDLGGRCDNARRVDPEVRILRTGWRLTNARSVSIRCRSRFLSGQHEIGGADRRRSARRPAACRAPSAPGTRHSATGRRQDNHDGHGSGPRPESGRPPRTSRRWPALPREGATVSRAPVRDHPSKPEACRARAEQLAHNGAGAAALGRGLKVGVARRAGAASPPSFTQALGARFAASARENALWKRGPAGQGRRPTGGSILDGRLPGDCSSSAEARTAAASGVHLGGGRRATRYDQPPWTSLIEKRLRKV